MPVLLKALNSTRYYVGSYARQARLRPSRLTKQLWTIAAALLGRSGGHGPPPSLARTLLALGDHWEPSVLRVLYREVISRRVSRLSRCRRRTSSHTAQQPPPRLSWTMGMALPGIESTSRWSWLIIRQARAIKSTYLIAFASISLVPSNLGKNSKAPAGRLVDNAVARPISGRPCVSGGGIGAFFLFFWWGHLLGGIILERKW